MSRLACLLVLAAALGPLASPATAAKKKVPRGFTGLVAEQTFAATGEPRLAGLRAQRAIGVTLLRQQFDWKTVEKAPGVYDLSYIDQYVLDAARTRITIMPILFNPPDFHSSRPATGAKRGVYPPRSNATFAAFARVLVARYGRRGTLWTGANAPLRTYAVRQWQIWNEPNLPFYWPTGRKPDPKAYARMAKTVGKAIKTADRTATVVGAGIPDSRNGVRFSKYVSRFLKAGGARHLGAFGVHPYGRTATQALRNVRTVRTFLDRRGARRLKLWVTESGWASQGPRSPYTVGPKRQSRFVGQFVRGIAKSRTRLKVKGFVLYSWQDAPPFPGGKDFWGLHTGLHRLDGRAKPTLKTFARANRSIGSG